MKNDKIKKNGKLKIMKWRKTNRLKNETDTETHDWREINTKLENAKQNWRIKWRKLHEWE
jgi:hypothetical protein